MHGARKAVELEVAGVVTEVAELACPEHAPVSLRDVAGESGVQECGHYEGHDYWSAEKRVQNVVELVDTAEGSKRFRQWQLQKKNIRDPDYSLHTC